MNYIDLFAGAGGLSEGFIRAGFKPVAHVEIDKHACETLKTRTAFHYLVGENKRNLYNDYISGKITRESFLSNVPLNLLDTIINEEISEKTIQKIFDRIDNCIVKNNIRNIDLLIGGPPCQAYSLVGRSRNTKKSEEEKKNDPRNYLYKQYVKFLKEYKPRMFIFENVPGLLSAGNSNYFQDLVNSIDEAEYEMDFKILDSSDYEVLQKRRRVIIIGCKKGQHFKYPDFKKIQHAHYVKSILDDLPELEPGETKNYYKQSANTYLIKTGIREERIDLLTQNISRSHNEHDRKIYKLVIEKWNKEGKRLLYNDLPEELQTHKNKRSFTDRFKLVAQNLQYSHTMVAHISQDGHFYIHPDIKQLRSLTVREAARIQSFQDNYFFEGPRTAMFKQIGNAVPVLMAETIAKEIKEILL